MLIKTAFSDVLMFQTLPLGKCLHLQAEFRHWVSNNLIFLPIHKTSSTQSPFIPNFSFLLVAGNNFPNTIPLPLQRILIERLFPHFVLYLIQLSTI